jgi:hypothetical protein
VRSIRREQRLDQPLEPSAGEHMMEVALPTDTGLETMWTRSFFLFQAIHSPKIFFATNTDSACDADIL